MKKTMFHLKKNNVSSKIICIKENYYSSCTHQKYVELEIFPAQPLQPKLQVVVEIRFCIFLVKSKKCQLNVQNVINGNTKSS